VYYKKCDYGKKIVNDSEAGLTLTADLTALGPHLSFSKAGVIAGSAFLMISTYKRSCQLLQSSYSSEVLGKYLLCKQVNL